MNNATKAFENILGILHRHGWDNPPPDPPEPETVDFSDRREPPDFALWERLAEAWRKAELGELKTPTERALWEIIKILERGIMKETGGT
jgi:hypothetical protein